MTLSFSRILVLGLFIGAIIGCTTVGIAQGKFKGGLIAGGSLSQMNGDEAYGYHKFGLTAGVRGGYNFPGRVTLEMELLFNQKGSKVAPKFVKQAGEWEFNFNYIEIPALVGFKDWQSEDKSFYHMQFYGGLSYGKLFSSSITNLKYQFIERDLNQNDVSFILGITYYINKHLGVTGRYNRSLTKVWKAKVVDGAYSRYMLQYQFNLCGIYMF